MRTNHKTRIGEKHKSLTLVSIEGAWDRSTWGRFRCDCGNEKTLRLYAVFSPSAKTGSCGCHKSAITAERNATHGLSHLPEYIIYAGMKARCLNKNNPAYHNYGGRGIMISDRWLEGFANFFEDMGPRPTPKHSIDRKDNDGPYSKGNCRWATDEEQADNRRNTVLIDGKTIKEIAAETGVKTTKLQSRYYHGVSGERFTAPGNLLPSDLHIRNKGESNGRAKLTAEKVKQIRSLVGNGVVRRDVAKMMGISLSAVDLIMQGRRWAHVA